MLTIVSREITLGTQPAGGRLAGTPPPRSFHAVAGPVVSKKGRRSLRRPFCRQACRMTPGSTRPQPCESEPRSCLPLASAFSAWACGLPYPCNRSTSLSATSSDSTRLSSSPRISPTAVLGQTAAWLATATSGKRRCRTHDALPGKCGRVNATCVGQPAESGSDGMDRRNELLSAADRKHSSHADLRGHRPNIGIRAIRHRIGVAECSTDHGTTLRLRAGSARHSDLSRG